MFEDYKALRPLREAAHLLAARQWPRLYDPGQLAQNDVPTAAAVYAHDMYVDRVLSEATVERVRNLRVWATDEYEHNGLTADGQRVLDHLIGLLRVV
jgi:pimeloyl-ACP methyl ester carboxylesterase